MKENGFSITIWTSPLPQRKENIATHLANGGFFRVNGIHGFVFADSSEYKQSVLRQLNRVVSRNDFYLYAVDHGSEPFKDEEFAVEDKKQSSHQVTINIQTNYGSVTGAVEKQIQQINNQLNTVDASHKEIADTIAQLTEAIDSATLPQADKVQAIERVGEVTGEVAMPIAERRGWKVVERVQGLGKFLTSLGTAYEGVQKVQPLVEKLIHLVASVFGVH